jgi:hypothetical protein
MTAGNAAYARFLPPAWAPLRAHTHTSRTWVMEIDGPGTARPVREALSRCAAVLLAVRGGAGVEVEVDGR